MYPPKCHFVFSPSFQDPGTSLDSDFFDDPVGDYSSDDDSDGTADDGGEKEVETDIEIGIVVIVVQLCIVRPRKCS